ncbi:Lipoprotein LipO precursor [Paenibacillus konkukensis]|uniref:Lipoprotein LipO n=1 Tax=Paenibacillus konkukensis TaxID=2020716 RepID=A0ABY4RPS3_9BACL|nr:extracellular solute-binding protein [Paenibacillus konkukensis]UQZ84093.1 Lipoprotein LipO precursor [Paenibacillus konkukensis]
MKRSYDARRVRLIALTAAAILILSSCSYGKRDARTDDAKPEEAPTPISMMVPLFQPQPPSDELMNELNAKTGAVLNVQWIPDDIYTNKMMNALETNTLKQVTYVRQIDYNLVKNAIRSGMFWDIGPYLDYYPNLKTLSKHTLDETKLDGKYYGLYNERPASRQGILIRKDWLERLNMKAPETIDELYQVIKAFTLNDPDGNGKQDTIGLTDRNDLVYGAFKTLSSYFGTPNNWLLSNGAFIPDFETPEYMDTMNFMKKLYNENIMNKDFPVASKQLQRYMLISGKAGVYVGSLSDAPRMLEEMKQVNAAADLTLVNRIQGPKGYGVWSIPDYSGLFLFSKKAIKTQEELKAILTFFDKSMNKDVSNLMLYGQEGKHYVLQNGEVAVPADMFQRMNAEVRPLLSLMIANISNPNLFKQSEQGQEPILQQVNRLVADNEGMLIHDPTVGLSSLTFDAHGTELASIMTNATYNYILGKIDAAGFRSEIESWKNKGGSQIVKEYEEAYSKSRSASP